MQRFGEKLRTLRKQHNLTRKQLAQEVGVAQSTIGDLEVSRNNPSANLVVRIATFFGVSLDVLMRDELDLDVDDTSS
jgi:transcriptional regulator with XRE-family HTH domain